MEDATAPAAPAFRERPIHDLPPAGLFLATGAVRTLRDALDRRRLLWVHGPGGAGKTVAVRLALEEAIGSGRWLGIAYLPCYRRLRFEEALHSLSDFLAQLGLEALAGVLAQSAHLEARVEVLLETLRRHPLVVWIDDLELLETGDERGGREILEVFLQGFAFSPQPPRSRVIVTSEAAPSGRLAGHALRLEPLRGEEARGLWDAFASAAGGPRPFPEDLVAVGEGLTPLAIRLWRTLFERAGPERLQELARARPPGELIPAVLETLSPATGELVDFLGASCRPLTRRALRSLLPPPPAPPGCGEGTDSRVVELLASGLAGWWRLRGEEVSACALHPAVQRFVERRLGAGSPERRRGALIACARHRVERALERRELWGLYEAYTLFFAAGEHDRAYQLQKLFLEDLLRFGYLDLARKVLSETVEHASGAARAVALGNLAIVHKNTADYDRALELYREVLAELELLGDQANLARVLHQLGNTHYLRGELEEAYRCYARSIETSEELGDRTTVTATRIQVANILYELGREGEALRNYEEALEALRPGANRALVAAVLLQVGQVHFQAGRYLEAEALLGEAEAEARAANDRRSLLKALRAQALVASRRREYDEALGLYTRGEGLAVELGDLAEAATFQLLQGEVERERLHLSGALHACLRAAETVGLLGDGRPAFRADLEPVARVVRTKLAELERTMGGEAYQRAERAYWSGREGQE